MQGLDLEPPTFRSEVRRANDFTTAPPRNFKGNIKKFELSGDGIKEPELQKLEKRELII